MILGHNLNCPKLCQFMSYKGTSSTAQYLNGLENPAPKNVVNDGRILCHFGTLVCVYITLIASKPSRKRLLKLDNKVRGKCKHLFHICETYGMRVCLIALPTKSQAKQ